MQRGRGVWHWRHGAGEGPAGWVWMASGSCHGSSSAMPKARAGWAGAGEEQDLPGAALGKLLEGGRLLLQMQRNCQGTEHSSQLWQRLCRCSGQVTFLQPRASVSPAVNHYRDVLWLNTAHTHKASRALWTDDPKEYKAFTWDSFPVLLSDLWCWHLNNLQREEGRKRPEAITPKHPDSSRHGSGVLGKEGMCSHPTPSSVLLHDDMQVLVDQFMDLGTDRLWSQSLASPVIC